MASDEGPSGRRRPDRGARSWDGSVRGRTRSSSTTSASTARDTRTVWPENRSRWAVASSRSPDSYDTMTAARSYKKPMAVWAARRELADCAGGQFDAEIVARVPEHLAARSPLANRTRHPARAAPVPRTTPRGRTSVGHGDDAGCGGSDGRRRSDRDGRRRTDGSICPRPARARSYWRRPRDDERRGRTVSRRDRAPTGRIHAGTERSHAGAADPEPRTGRSFRGSISYAWAGHTHARADGTRGPRAHSRAVSDASSVTYTDDAALTFAAALCRCHPRSRFRPRVCRPSRSRAFRRSHSRASRRCLGPPCRRSRSLGRSICSRLPAIDQGDEPQDGGTPNAMR